MDEEKQVVVEESRGLTFKDILFIIRKHWIAIVAFVAVGIIGGGVFTRVNSTLRPKYTSTGTMLVSYESDKSSSITTDYNFSNYITNTYVAFIKENAVLENAAEKLNTRKENGLPELNKPIKFTAGILRSNLSVSANSLILKVSYTASDKVDAKVIVQTIIDTASEVADSPKTDENGNIIYKKDANGNNTAEAEPKYRFLNGNLTPVSQAKNGAQVSHTVRDLAIGLGAGIILALGYVVVRELSDNTFKSAEEIERTLNIPVLAGIPDYHFDDEKKGGK